ncbi:MAG: L-threonylcarbamoyladenylate synthase [Minisyncoccia bacterium]
MDLIKINKQNLKEILKDIEEKLNKRKIIVYPTDTVYGLISNAFDKKCVNLIFKIKKRPTNKVLPIFIKNFKTAEDFFILNKDQKKLIKKYLPGKVTFIVKVKENKKKYFPDGVITKDGKVGFRIPNFIFLNKLLSRLKFPLTSTSANISGNKDLLDIKEVIKEFKNKKYKPNLILDFGKLKKSLPSTVLDISEYPPKIEIKRKGAIKI